MDLFCYQTDFSLTEPVNDYRAAKEYLEEDDMVQYLKHDVEYHTETGINPDDLVSIDWILEDAMEGVIELRTKVELTEDQLAYISDWVKGQCSDGIGEGFEQQDFAEHYEEDEYGDIDELSYTMSSFDWETNDYPFRMTYRGQPKKVQEDKLRNSVVRVTFDMSGSNGNAFSPDELKKGIISHLRDADNAEYIKSAKIKSSDDAGFDVYLYTTVDLRKVPAYVLSDFQYAIEDYVSSVNSLDVSAQVENESKQAHRGHVLGLMKKRLTGSIKGLNESVYNAEDYTEANPLELQLSGGPYYIWQVGSSIYGSPNKSDAKSNIVNARSCKNFTDNGFKYFDAVVDYVKRYF